MFIFNNIFKKTEIKNNKNIKTEKEITIFSPIKLSNNTEINQEKIDKNLEKTKQKIEKITNSNKIKHIIWAGINACIIYTNGKHEYISKEKALKIKKQ